MDYVEGRNQGRCRKIVFGRPLYRFTAELRVAESLSSRGRTYEMNLGPLDLGMPITEEIFSLVTTTSPFENLIVKEFAVEAQKDSYKP